MRGASNAHEHVWLLSKQHPTQIHPPRHWSQILWLLLLWYVSSPLHPLQAAAGGLQLHPSFIKDQNVHVTDGVNNNNCVSNSANGRGLPFIHLKCLKSSSSTDHPFFRQLSGVVLASGRNTSRLRDDETKSWLQDWAGSLFSLPSCCKLWSEIAAEARPWAVVQEQPIDHVCPSNVSSEKFYLKI